MANTIGTPTINRARKSFGGWFSEMWSVQATISDQDAITATDTLRLSLTVPGVALGDMCIGVSFTNDLSDGTDQITVTAVVTAADTVTLNILADVGQYAIDDLNNAVVRILVARPDGW